ncbi:MAG: hypothetical protein ACYCOU_19070 [Sulfobacillus sp.]
MSIDSRSLDTDVTLEIDEDDITLSEFGSALDHFTGLVKEVSKRVSPNQKHQWLVKVYPGSAGIGLSGKVGTISKTDVNVIVGSILDGISALEKGERHPSFSDKAIEHALGLHRSFSKRQGQARIRVWDHNKTSRTVTSAVSTGAAQILDPVYEDDGSIEGTLEVVSGHGTLRVVVYDAVDARPVKCELNEKDIQTAIEAFMRRVEVYGKVRYRRDGNPVSVKVNKIIPFPSRDEIPSLDEMRGILRQ